MQQHSNTVARQNLLLASLPAADRRHLLAQCEPLELTLASVLHEADEPLRHVIFPTSGLISLITPTTGYDRMEVGLIGNEGMLGTSVVLGVESAPVLAVVQGAGTAWQIHTRSFHREIDRSGALQRGLKRYVHVVMTQLAQMAVCTRFHVVEARLARWLLMTGDRSHSDDFHLTHEFLSNMLGVRRAGVTHAASALQSRNLVRYHRGDMSILDRGGLENAACRCYATDQETYARVMSQPGNSRRLPIGSKGHHRRPSRAIVR